MEKAWANRNWKALKDRKVVRFEKAKISGGAALTSLQILNHRVIGSRSVKARSFSSARSFSRSPMELIGQWRNANSQSMSCDLTSAQLALFPITVICWEKRRKIDWELIFRERMHFLTFWKYWYFWWIYWKDLKLFFEL